MDSDAFVMNISQGFVFYSISFLDRVIQGLQGVIVIRRTISLKLKTCG